MKILPILMKLIPAIRRTIRALGKDSPGGKKITKDETAAIALILAGEIVEVIEGL